MDPDTQPDRPHATTLRAAIPASLRVGTARSALAAGYAARIDALRLRLRTGEGRDPKAARP